MIESNGKEHRKLFFVGASTYIVVLDSLSDSGIGCLKWTSKGYW